MPRTNEDTTESKRTESTYHQSLNGIWEFRESGADEWHSGSVPGDVYSDLLLNDLIDHPYDEDVELDVQWVARTDWTYRRTFEVDETLLERDVQLLECSGIDTVAEITINGTTVGETRNMHREYAFDVADALVPGENHITVAFRSPVEYAVEKRDEHPHDVPLLRYPVDQPGRNFVRKAQCHFGWDWGPCLPGVGIWRDIRIVGYSDPRIEAVRTEQHHHDDGDVTLSVRIDVDAPRSTTADLRLSIADERVAEPVSLDAGRTELDAEIVVSEPDLWWPNGYGDQHLSELTVSVVVDRSDTESRDTATERIGFRTLELVRESDDDGESFYFQVNGVPIFAKGANWIPIDALRGDVTADRYDTLLTDAVAANMNTIRVWGGGYYEHDVFYDLCDELGILVWQDFMFSCALYPADDAFLAAVEREVRDQVQRLESHPSVALWCANNENEMGLRSWFADEPHLDELVDEYRRLTDETIATVVAETDPGRPYWPGSPSSGGTIDDDGRPDPYDESRGDLHYWDVWHDGEPFVDYLDVEPRFVSEFGYQSFPSVATLSSVLPDEELNPTAPLMEHHQRNEGGNKRILQRMADHFRIPHTFVDFVYCSQLQQGLAMQVAIEHWRRLQPYCMGTLYWQLNDLWPCASWSSIEYGGDWKALQYMTQRFYAPILVSTSLVRAGSEGENGHVDGDDGHDCTNRSDTLEVWLTVDGREPAEGHVTVEGHTFDGAQLLDRRAPVSVDAGESCVVATVSIDDVLGDVPRESVLFRVDYDGGGESYANVTFLEPFKRLELPDPGLSVEVEASGGREGSGTEHDSTVVVETDHAALFVALSAPSLAGRFTENYFHMVPGERKRVRFVPRADETPVTADELRDDLAVTNLCETY